MDEPQYGGWLPPNVAVHGGDIDTMIILIHWFMLALFIGWGAFIVYCLVRFRARQGHVATYQPIKAKFSKWVEVGVAVAEAVGSMQPETLELIRGGSVGKGDVFEVARLAGIAASKRAAMGHSKSNGNLG